MTVHVEQRYMTPTGRSVHKLLSEGRMFVSGWVASLVGGKNHRASILTGPFIHIRIAPNYPDQMDLSLHIDLGMAAQLAEDIQKKIAELKARGVA